MTSIPIFLEIHSKFPHVTISFLKDNPRTRAGSQRTPIFTRFPSAVGGHPFVECSSVFPSPFPAVSRDGRGDRGNGPSSGTRLSLLRPPGLNHERPVLFPSQPSSALDPKPPHSAIHPLTYPDPVACGPPPPHPDGAATPRARLTVIALVHAPSVCRQPAYQLCRSAHVTKFLLLLLSLFTCLETWSVVYSFTFSTSLRVFDFRHRPTPSITLHQELVSRKIAAAAYVRARA